MGNAPTLAQMWQKVSFGPLVIGNPYYYCQV